MKYGIIAIAFDSEFGHTRMVSEAVARGASRIAGVKAVSLNVSQLNDEDWATLGAAQAIIFGSPTRMGGPSASFVSFAEATSRFWPSQAWRDKLSAGFATSSAMAGGKLSVLRYMVDLASQHGMLWVTMDLKAGWNSTTSSPHDPNRLGYRLGVGVQCNVDATPMDIIGSDLVTAEHLGQRVARLARWVPTATRTSTDAPPHRSNNGGSVALTGD
jgi:NAD(P)H dehydrogenase (quinone)